MDAYKQTISCTKGNLTKGFSQYQLDLMGQDADGTYDGWSPESAYPAGIPTDPNGPFESVSRDGQGDAKIVTVTPGAPGAVIHDIDPFDPNKIEKVNAPTISQATAPDGEQQLANAKAMQETGTVVNEGNSAIIAQQLAEQNQEGGSDDAQVKHEDGEEFDGQTEIFGDEGATGDGATEGQTGDDSANDDGDKTGDNGATGGDSTPPKGDEQVEVVNPPTPKRRGQAN